MALYVQKYGGVSVASVEHIVHVAEKVIQTRQQGHDIVVVVSAMNGDTDRLIGLAKTLATNPDGREYDALISTGEQITTALLCIALKNKGYEAESFTGKQAQIFTDQIFKKARITNIEPAPILAAIEKGRIPVVAGFQGTDGFGNVTTLGRGGSDTTAVALAAVLQAKECQFYKEVEGVYTTDPRIVPQARRLNRITFEEMLEMASLGAKVLQNRAVEFAGKYKVPMRVMSTFVEGPGTLITFDDKTMESPIVSGIAYNKNEARITVIGLPDMPGAEFKIFGEVSRANIDVDMIVQNIGLDGKTTLSFTVSRDEFQNALQLVRKLADEMGASQVLGDPKIAKLSIVGLGMRSHTGVASRMFETLAELGIKISLISTSEIKVSVVVDEKYLELGIRALHEAFRLEEAPIEEFDPL